MIRSTFNVCMFFVLALLIAQVVGAPASKDALDALETYEQNAAASVLSERNSGSAKTIGGYGCWNFTTPGSSPPRLLPLGDSKRLFFRNGSHICFGPGPVVFNRTSLVANS
ncbi:hypothetical protein BC629DRAFT_1596428 [Irpex lacteus]|nr:hypothetical protein BC629DRAFT_1596428 [Irpex lacteus]